ncbi:MAG: hypothetical protein OXI15_21665 [Chromatiales bacterium]|nr:hypothetical protein [Chromatiales bacterium]
MSTGTVEVRIDEMIFEKCRHGSPVLDRCREDRRMIDIFPGRFQAWRTLLPRSVQ